MRGCRLLLIVVDVRKCIFHTRRSSNMTDLRCLGVVLPWLCVPELSDACEAKAHCSGQRCE